VGVLLALSTGDVFLATVAELTLAFCLLSQSFGLVAGYAGRLAFGNAMFFGIGGYAVAAGEFYQIYPPLVGLAIGLVVCGALAGLLSLILWRLTNLMFALVTYALAAILLAIFSLPDVIGGPLGVVASAPSEGSDVVNLSLSSDWQWILAGAILVLLTVIGVDKLRRSRVGMQLAAVRGDRSAAAASGLDGRKLTSIVWAVSACIASVAGSYYFAMSGFLDPVSAYGLKPITFMIVPAILGGLLSPWGPVVGSVVLPLGFYLNQVVGSQGSGGMDQLAYAVILILTIRLIPLGVIHYASALLHAVVNSAPYGLLVQGRQQSFVLPTAPRATVDSPEADGREGLSNSLEHGDGVDNGRFSVIPASVEEGRPSDARVDSREPLLVISDLRKSFGGVEALAGVNLSIAAGELVGVIGPNGAGKTTLFKCISGEVSADSGSIQFDGQETTGRQAYELARLGVRRTFQIPRIFSELTVQENIAIPLMRSLDKDAALARAADIADTVGLTRVIGANPQELSTVDQRRIELGRAVAGDVRLLLLDEVMSGLSEEEAARMTQVVSGLSENFGVAAVVVEHVIGFLTGIVDRVVVVAGGTIIADGPANIVVDDQAVSQAYFGKYAPIHAEREGNVR
jgi:branched-chain amino acid transport system permease protein